MRGVSRASPGAPPRAPWQCVQEAQRLGLEAEPRFLEPGRRETDEESLIRAVIEQRVQTTVPDDAACRAFHAAHRELFRSPPLYAASHILLAARPDTPERGEALAAARAILQRLSACPQDFEELARSHSACPSRASGGRLGQIAAGDTVPEFEAALAAMKVGAVAAEPVASCYGIHVVRLDDRAEGAELPFEAVRERIRDMIERAGWARAAKALVVELAAAARITGVDFTRAA